MVFGVPGSGDDLRRPAVHTGRALGAEEASTSLRTIAGRISAI